jgi:hypothetical protein
MIKRKRDRRVEIFNFSFLDILACTIGLLIFILVMVFILQSGSPVADLIALINQKKVESSALHAAADRDIQIAESIEAQFTRFDSKVDSSLISQRDAASASRDQAASEFRTNLDKLHRLRDALDQAKKDRLRRGGDDLRKTAIELSEARKRLASAKERLAHEMTSGRTTDVLLLPQGGTEGEPKQVLHVECRADKVVLLAIDADGKAHEVGHSAADSLADPNSAFMRAVSQQLSLPRPHVLFWVRPDGIQTLGRALEALPPSLPRGFEPADSDWRFDGAALRRGFRRKWLLPRSS